MEYSLTSYIPFSLFFFFYFSTISFTLFSLFLYITKLVGLFKPSCKCDICKTYLSKSWSSDFENLSDWYAHLLRRSPTGTIHIHVLNNTVTANPENVEHMLRTNFDNYPKGRPFSAILGDLLGKGIFNVDGHSWRFQRKIASLELGSVSIRSHAFEIVSSEIQNRLIPLLSSVRNDVVLDLQDLFRRFSFDTICRFSFGLDPGCLKLSLPVSDFAAAFDLASRLSAKRAMAVSPLIWKMKRLLNLGDEKKLKEAIKSIDYLAGELINHRREAGFSTQKDLLSRFMGTITDDRYLRDIVVSFLLAGRDTVAAALTS